MTELIDKNAIMQVFGSLMQTPLLFAEIGDNGLIDDDFTDRFTKSIFYSIYNLYHQGSEKITVVDIDNYLQGHQILYVDFQKQNGVAYLQDCLELANKDSFKYYYNRIKKFSLLRQLQKSGFEVSQIYPLNEVDSKKEKKMLDEFEQADASSLLEFYSKRLNELDYKFNNANSSGDKAEMGLTNLVEELRQFPEIGLPLAGKYYNTIVRGARKGKLYINSGASGVGKSRMMIGEACQLAYPYRWEINTWVKNSSYGAKVLVLTTELEKDEVQTIILSNVTGINEEKILYGTYTPEESDRITEAIEMMEQNSNLFIESLPDPSITAIKSIIKKHASITGVEYVFYDYIFSSPNLLSEFKDARIREDVSLMMLSTALKDIAVEYNLFVMTATQVSGEFVKEKGIKNERFVRGSKAIIDKCDVAFITLPITEEEKGLLSSAMAATGMPIPTHVKDIYKLRRGRYKNVRIWSILDLGTSRVVDLFVTDSNFDVIDIPVNNTEVIRAVDFEINEDNLLLET